MADEVSGEAPAIDPADYMKGQMVMALRDVERRFQGAHVTVIISMPDTALDGGKPQYSHATSAQPADLAAVLRDLADEVEEPDFREVDELPDPEKNAD